MNDLPDHNDGRAFRWTIGLIVMLTAIGGFAALFYVKVPIENKDAMMFALGAVFQWAAGVVASEYGATTTGRKVAESAIRKIEREDKTTSTSAPDALNAGDRPTGAPGDPVHTTEEDQ